jgi:hypothetical protein
VAVVSLQVTLVFILIINIVSNQTTIQNGCFNNEVVTICNNLDKFLRKFIKLCADIQHIVLHQHNNFGEASLKTGKPE